MKHAVNVRLEERIVYTIGQLAEQMQTTKTEIIEKAVEMFARNHYKAKDDLLEFAGVLKPSDAENILEAVSRDKDTKEFEGAL